MGLRAPEAVAAGKGVVRSYFKLGDSSHPELRRAVQGVRAGGGEVAIHPFRDAAGRSLLLALRPVATFNLWTGNGPEITRDSLFAGMVLPEQELTGVRDELVARIDRIAAESRLSTLGVALALAVSLAAMLFAVRQTSQVRLLTRGVEAVKQKRYDVPVAVVSSDDLGDLTRAFNGMIQEIRSSYDQPQQHAEQLEGQVRERTRELEEKNRELERLSITDRLTGLFNRARLDQVLSAELRECGDAGDGAMPEPKRSGDPHGAGASASARACADQPAVTGGIRREAYRWEALPERHAKGGREKRACPGDGGQFRAIPLRNLSSPAGATSPDAVCSRRAPAAATKRNRRGIRAFDFAHSSTHWPRSRGVIVRPFTPAARPAVGDCIPPSGAQSERGSMTMKFAGFLLAFWVLAAGPAAAGEFDSTVPMKSKGSSTFYVPGHIEGLGEVEMMVDTGSSYLTINEEALAVLSKGNRANYVRNLKGTLANGAEVVVPVYNISVKIGSDCRLENVEAAVFPGKTRYILGLNALSKAAPFIFSTAPPTLVLSHCTQVNAQGPLAAPTQVATHP